MDINSLLNEDAFFAKYPLIVPLPKELYSDSRTARQYQGYINADVCFAAYRNEKISIEEEILISIPDGYPRNLPVVYLLEGGRIANYGADFHFYPHGQLCIGHDWEVRNELYKDPSLLHLIESFIIPHLAATRYVMQCPANRSYPQGEYSHAAPGRIEGLSDFFNIPKNERILFDVLKFLSKPHKVANKMLCPFGCGVKYSRCQCKGNIKQLQKLIPPKEAIKILNEVNTFIMEQRLLQAHSKA